MRATSSVCSLPRKRGRGGEGVAGSLYHVACPLPVPPPHAGEGTMWHLSHTLEEPSPFQLSPNQPPLRNDPRPRLSRHRRVARVRRGVVRRAAGRRRYHLAGPAHRHLGHVLVAAVAAVAAACVIAWSILRAIVRAPDVVSRYLRIRRGVRGYRAVSQGLIAVGSGDARAAKKFTAEAVRIAPREPLTLLLSAQSAQLSGDRDAAVATFQEMADRDDTRVLGLHG